MGRKRSLGVGPGAGRRLFRAAFGTWLVVGGSSAASWVGRAWGWWVVILPAYAAALGLLLIVEACLVRRRPGRLQREADAAAAGVELPPEPEAGTGILPVELHVGLTLVVMLAAISGGGVVGYDTVGAVLSLRRPWANADGILGAMIIALCWLIVFGGAALSGAQIRRLCRQYVPARCRRCGRAAWWESGSPVRYRCRACKEISTTSWHED